MTNNKDLLIEPFIYHGPGCCPICSTELLVAERETIIMRLDKSGNAVSVEGADVICRGLCPNCGHKLDMMRSNGIYKPYSYAAALFDEVDRRYEIDRRNKEGSYRIEGNPLSI